MNEENANNRNNIGQLSEFVRQNPVLVNVLKLCVVSLFLLPLIHHSIFHYNDNQQQNQSEISENLLPKVEDVIEEKIVVRKKVIIVPQPSCPPENVLEKLLNICRMLYEEHMLCAPGDKDNVEKHKVPKYLQVKNNTSSSGEPRGTIVGCVAAGLLLTSLGAAFVELYKAKSQTNTTKTKAPMSRKCSLADLTVLKHNRKELVRRESILELPESGQSKSMGLRIPPPLNRRCSFPVGPISYGTESRRTSMEYRRVSIIDSRRNSDDRRTSIDDSPERRHWSRLVHRH